MNGDSLGDMIDLRLHLLYLRTLNNSQEFRLSAKYLNHTLSACWVIYTIRFFFMILIQRQMLVFLQLYIPYLVSNMGLWNFLIFLLFKSNFQGGGKGNTGNFKQKLCPCSNLQVQHLEKVVGQGVDLVGH